MRFLIDNFFSVDYFTELTTLVLSTNSGLCVRDQRRVNENKYVTSTYAGLDKDTKLTHKTKRIR